MKHVNGRPLVHLQIIVSEDAKAYNLILGIPVVFEAELDVFYLKVLE